MIAYKNLTKFIALISISLIVSACGGVSATDAQQNNTFADSGGGTGSGSSGSGSTSNTAPVIYGTPGTSIASGLEYTFTPNAYDADGDTLSFSISNKPTWASFNTSTGTLKGIPGTNDAGTTSNIKISVSDSKSSTILAPFNVTVMNVTAIDASFITWTIPTEFEDGSTAYPADIGGYKIYRGTSYSNMSVVATVTDSYTSEYDIHSLGSGTYYFSVSAYDSEGVESTATTPLLINVL